MTAPSSEPNPNDIAIVGMAARFPGARNIREYWENLRNGVETIRRLDDEELLANGVTRAELEHPRYVKAAATLGDMDRFDPEFFGFSPKEAAILDPQHRHFMECAWEALEDAGHPPEKFEGLIGIFGGVGMGSYFVFNLLSNPELVDSVGLFLLRHTGNDKDFLTTRVAYLFDLKGPAINVQTACSTSLVAVHMAAQTLLSGECDMALAGGVTIEIPHGRGYRFEEGEILSPDGHCRSFDHRSQGTVFGSGTGVVVLRRLADALEDGDHVHAVLRGSAINNDGADKVGYLAPSVDGQAAAIAEAISIGGVDADTIELVECHGTGTVMGDPIEIAALTQAFRESTEATGYCGIGSVKSNFGHLDTAAGVASLIKAALALQHGEMPPSLNYEAPNPAIDFGSSPFYVNTELKPWPRKEHPRRAGVNSLGVGGTNAYAVLEEPPARPAPAATTRRHQLFTLSARNRSALDEYCERLAEELRGRPEEDLPDVAYTLHVGRRAFEQRRVFAAADREEAIRALEAPDPQRVFTHQAGEGEASVVFLLPGGGAQHPDMGRDLYAHESVFREHVDRGIEELQALEGVDLRPLLHPTADRFEEVRRELERPSLQLPAIFIVEYALAQLWMSWGMQPNALIGHSMGENTAACLAGVLSFRDTLGLIALRGRLFERVPEGGMLSVSLPAADLEPLLPDDLQIAAVNAPELCVASGPAEALDALARELEQREVEFQRIPITIAAHSRLVEPILGEFGAYLEERALSPPSIPFVSNRSGTWITDEEATDPAYWVNHLRHTVRFADGVGTLLEDPRHVFIEVGPGRTLSSLVRQHGAATSARTILSSLPHPDQDVPDDSYALTVLGRLWASGVPVAPDVLWPDEARRRLSLPTYAFQHQRYWIDPGRARAGAEASDGPTRIERVEDWFSKPIWERRPAPESTLEPSTWLVFADGAGVGTALAARLRAAGHTVVTVKEGDGFAVLGEDGYTLSPEFGPTGYQALVRELVSSGRTPAHIVHLWSVTADESFRPGSSFFHHVQERGYYSLLFLVQALGEEEGLPDAVQITAVSNGMQEVDAEGLRHPEKSTLLGPVQVVPREFPGFTCKSVDVVLPRARRSLLTGRLSFGDRLEAVVAGLHAEVLAEPESAIVALRRDGRFVRGFARAAWAPTNGADHGRLRSGGVYLVTGGLGGLGLVVAEHLARTVGARLVLVSRSTLPDRGAWDAWEAAHEPDDKVSRRIARVRAIEELGGEVLLARADVTDVEEMRAVLEAARERFGPLNGVFHTAGVVRDELIQMRDEAGSEEVFGPKVQGTLVLDSLLRDEPLDVVVLFSSTSTVIAPPGQVDYVGANAFLNAYATSRRDRGRRLTVAVNWGVWNEVGMAVEAVTTRDGSEAAEPARPVTQPLLDERTVDRKGRVVLEAVWDPATHWVLGDHRTGAGHALLPGTGFLELAREALRALDEESPFEIRDLFLFRPLHVGDGDPRRVRVRLTRTDEGYGYEVLSLCTVDDGRQGWQTHAQARLLLQPLPAAEAVSLDAVRERCSRRSTPLDEGGLHTKQEDHLLFGPRWRVLHQVSFGAEEALARVVLPKAFQEDVTDFALHPALVDLAVHAGLPGIEGYEAVDALWVPVSYEHVRVHGPLPARAWSWVRSRGENQVDDEFVGFDVTLLDDEGAVVVEVEGFSLHRVGAGLDVTGTRRPSPSEVELEDDGPGSGQQALSPAEIALRGNIERGIRPADGTQALQRILAGPQAPWVVVSSMELDDLIRQTEELGSRQEPSAVKFERPQLGSEYVAPSDEIERTLAGFWEELLGVDSIGIRDSFFDLGGHSLIAVRLFAKVKKAYGVEYPISVLFEAPTIEACAGLIRSQIDSGDAGGDGPVEHTSRFNHLVAMHSGSGGAKTPFFLVAGMFGNVLNLRHLAHLLGADRPFYGLQARGLYGDHAPHETFEETARDYIAELREVQPHGPYLLGGFSGGGITAYEIARQLREAGEEVALLVLLDTPLTHPPEPTRQDKVHIHWQRVKSRGPAYLLDWTRDKVRWHLGRLQRRMNGAAVEERTAEFHNDEIEAAFRRSLDRYDLRPQDVDVALFRPRLEVAHVLPGNRRANSRREIVLEDNGWTPLVANLEIHEVPGDHDGMVLEPNVRVLAARLQRCIEAVEGRLAAGLVGAESA